MSIEDVGLNPRRIAEAILAQLEGERGAVPVREIALALDIEWIRAEPLSNIEAALVTTAERDRGQILLNSRSSRQRQRFSLGHELLHFLNPLHEQTSEGGFQCSRLDMRASASTQGRHERQESEANEFAIELLTPRSVSSPSCEVSRTWSGSWRSPPSSTLAGKPPPADMCSSMKAASRWCSATMAVSHTQIADQTFRSSIFARAKNVRRRSCRKAPYRKWKTSTPPIGWLATWTPI